jgi:2-iminoacetate synthase
MSFVEAFNNLPFEALLSRAATTDGAAPRAVLDRGVSSLADFATLLSPAASGHLEELCRRSQTLTRQRFGRTIRLFAPLYLSNECINNCAYCGFSRDNPILRVTLSVEEVEREARALAEQGFRNILLVAGEHPKFVSSGYMADCVRRLHPFVPSISLEVGPMETPEYVPLVAAGAEGLVVYQETYDRAVYSKMHTLGPKRDFDWRLATPERAYEAGFRRLGIAALYGLSDWRREALSVAAHASWLLKHCWKAQVTVSLPRLRPCAGEFQPLTSFADRDLVQVIAAMRLFLPDVGIVLSTRENAGLRDRLLPLGITHASAGSHTEPGGYTGAGKDSLHHTVRGRIVELSSGAAGMTPAAGRATGATGQFDIADDRPPEVVAEQIRRLGYEPVWKDWDAALSA